MAAQRLHQHGGAGAVGLQVLADFVEAEAAVEKQGRVGAFLDEHLAAQFGITRLGVALHVGIQRTTDTAAAAPAGHRDAVDVEEVGITLAEPAEVGAVVVAAGAERHQHAGDVAAVLGHPEVFGGVVETPQAGGVDGEDAGAGVVVEG